MNGAILCVDALREQSGLSAIAVCLGDVPHDARIIRWTRDSYEAEYRAVLFGLTIAEQRDYPVAAVHCDCLSVVHSIVEDRPTRPELEPLKERAQRILARHRNWKLRWKARHGNVAADRLAAAALRSWKAGYEDRGSTESTPEYLERTAICRVG